MSTIRSFSFPIRMELLGSVVEGLSKVVLGLYSREQITKDCLNWSDLSIHVQSEILNFFLDLVRSEIFRRLKFLLILILDFLVLVRSGSGNSVLVRGSLARSWYSRITMQLLGTICPLNKPTRRCLCRPGFPNSLFPSWDSCFVSQKLAHPPRRPLMKTRTSAMILG